MGVNKAILVGNLGRDPELRFTNQQLPVCSFSVATTEKRKDATGKYVDQTEWHNIVTFEKVAENCGKYLKKGSQVYVEGRIQTRKWQDKEGKDRYTTEILANSVQFIGTRANVTSSDSSKSDEVFSGLESTQTGESSGADEVSFDDDDIPF